MENNETNKEEIFSKPVRSGKRTYFMDVKEMKSGDRYITITESKRKFVDDLGKFIYEKHKIFLYPEDFDKFIEGLEQAVHFVRTGEAPKPDPEEEPQESNSNYTSIDEEFEALS